MKKLTLALTLAAALAGVRNASAATVTALIHGSSCFNTTSGANIGYSQWGPFNPSTTTGVSVNCPVNLSSQNYTSMQLQISGWSRNNSASKLSCTINNTAGNGNNLTGSTVTLPFNAGAPGVNWTTVFPSWQNVWPYITCYIPPNNGNGWSYLSSLHISATY